ncbi:MAG: DUF1501 domain-containing protein [Planctomycetia bacterium]|nr:DUF1501 domain-containing protein [Planctomycetia bacterium]
MATHRYCDGVRRRDFLKAGVLSGIGLTLADYLRLASAGEVSGSAKAKAAIFINLSGGPTHMDTFDLKPDAPAEYRGEFNPMKTNADGVEICEHLPRLAKCADKFAILRGVSHTLAAHDLGTKYMNTGNRPLPSLIFPGYGAVVGKELGGPADLPPFVAVPNTPQTAGYLGIRYAPFQTNATPAAGRPFTVRGVALRSGLTVSDVERRQDLLKKLDKTFAQNDTDDLVDGLDKFAQQAHEMITSPRARKAFDISQENKELADLFGATPLGQSCLLASRLVEHGVRFVTVSFGGWDTHQNNFPSLKDRQLPPLDQGVSGLLTALDTKGLLESTAVFVTGEFGRTPKINARAGRDHWPRAMFCVLAGGGFKGGQVIGASDDKGMGPAETGITPDDVAASFYHALGIDHTKEYHSNTGRPVMIVRNGNVIDRLFA